MMKKIINGILIGYVAFVSFFGISAFFINSAFFERILYKGLKLKISPGFIGGNKICDIYDEVDDDFGNGNAVYPHYADFKEGSLDLIRYTVHEPVYDAVWQQNPEYWQLDLEYKNGIAEVRNIYIFINTDKNEGENSWLFNDSNKMGFDEKFPWNFAIWIKNGTGTVYNSKKEMLCNTENYVRKNGRQILIRIPLVKKELQTIYKADVSYHYVVTGAYSRWEADGFIPEGESEGIYDVLDVSDDYEKSQTAQLKAKKLIPVEVKMKPEKISVQDNSLYEKIISEKNCWETKIGDDTESENYYENLEGLEQKLQLNSETPLLNAFYGVELAKKGGKSGPFAAMKLVNKAFIFLDKACKLAENSNDEIEVLLNRAGVAESVPDSIFGKTIVAAKDYERCAQLLLKQAENNELSEYQKILLAYFYIKAAENYKKIEMTTESFLNECNAKKYYQRYNGESE